MEKITFNNEQLEFLKFIVQDFEYNDDHEKYIIEQIENKIYQAQENQALRVLHGLTTQSSKVNAMPKVRIDSFDLTEEEYLLFQDNELSLYEILDDRFAKDQLHIYIDE